jgi:hypothetical protein
MNRIRPSSAHGIEPAPLQTFVGTTAPPATLSVEELIEAAVERAICRTLGPAATQPARASHVYTVTQCMRARSSRSVSLGDGAEVSAATVANWRQCFGGRRLDRPPSLGFRSRWRTTVSIQLSRPSRAASVQFRSRGTRRDQGLLLSCISASPTLRDAPVRRRNSGGNGVVVGVSTEKSTRPQDTKAKENEPSTCRANTRLRTLRWADEKNNVTSG